MTDCVSLKITGCNKCPNHHVIRHYTSDSFEMVMKWQCRQSNYREIALVDVFDKTPPIPSWCPLRD